MLEVIAFDADDTLWHNESLYSETQEQFKRLLAPYCTAEQIAARLFDTEMRNLEAYGYGIKGFTLSMIETAIDLTGGRISGVEVAEIIGFARQMLAAPVQVLEGVQEVIPRLAASHRLMLITKGDLFDQETKIARSGLGDFFQHIEIVSHKSQQVYASILARHAIPAQRFMMVGNSLRSDVLPVAELGGQAVHIPYHLTWAHENPEAGVPDSLPVHHLEHIRELPDLVQRLDGDAKNNF